MIEKIIVTDLQEAAAIASSPAAYQNYTAWITTVDIDDEAVCLRVAEDFTKRGIPHIYRYFYDIEDGLCVHTKGAQEEDLQIIISFFRTLKHSDKNHVVGINCMAGVARSTAIAIVGWMVQCYQPEVALAKTLAVRRVAWPNLHILQLADKILGTDSFSVISSWRKNTRPQSGCLWAMD